MAADIEAKVAKIAAAPSETRHATWINIVNSFQVRRMLEVGVWKGEFAALLLKNCPRIEAYHMIDPWRHMAEWNKPFNIEQAALDDAYREAMARTEFALERRIVHRGTTIEVIEEIPDGTLDLAYIDGDHTLRGITIDLLRVWPKVRAGGIVGGDDYAPSIWQHPDRFEPTLVFPLASHFAEGVGAPLVILQQNQFAMIKPMTGANCFRIVDTTGLYGDRSLLSQVRPR